MKKQPILVLICILTSYSVWAQQSITRKLTEFNGVKVGEAIKVTLVHGNKYEADITASNIDLDDIETEVFGNTLRIEIKGNQRRNNINVEIVLTYKALASINVSSAAHVKTEGSLRTDNLDLSVSSAGSAWLELDAGSVEVTVTSAGEAELSGRTGSQRVEVSSAGQYDGLAMTSDKAYVRASSAGTAKVLVHKEIDAHASSGGHIKYKGNPDKVYVNSSSGGSVNKSR